MLRYLRSPSVKRAKIEKSVDNRTLDERDVSVRGVLEEFTSDYSTGNTSINSQTGLETFIPAPRTDENAISNYEASKAKQNGVLESTDTGQLYRGQYTKGKSSIYIEAFNHAVESVLRDESHLFNDNEMALFHYWRTLSYESQYLYGLWLIANNDH